MLRLIRSSMFAFVLVSVLVACGRGAICVPRRGGADWYVHHVDARGRARSREVNEVNM